MDITNMIVSALMNAQGQAETNPYLEYAQNISASNLNRPAVYGRGWKAALVDSLAPAILGLGSAYLGTKQREKDRAAAAEQFAGVDLTNPQSLLGSSNPILKALGAGLSIEDQNLQKQREFENEKFNNQQILKHKLKMEQIAEQESNANIRANIQESNANMRANLAASVDKMKIYAAQEEAQARLMEAAEKGADALRKEWNANPQVEALIEAKSNLNAMGVSFNRKDKASDLNFIFSVMKVLDPRSVVREGEQIVVRKTNSIPDDLWAMYKNVEGGANISPTARKGLLQTAIDSYSGRALPLQAQYQSLKGIAQRRNYNTKDIFLQGEPEIITGFAIKKDGSLQWKISKDGQEFLKGIR